MIKLNDIANIITGHVFRSKIEYSASGNVNLISMESISTEGLINITNNDIKKVFVSDFKSSEIVKQNDILFKAKGLANNAVVINSIPDNTTVTASCLIIRVTVANILPEYVCCWLNSSFAKEYFSKSSGQATGVTIANVSKKTLEDLPIKIPSIEKQHSIAEISYLSRQEINILKEITAKKEQLNNIVLTKQLQKI